MCVTCYRYATCVVHFSYNFSINDGTLPPNWAGVLPGTERYSAYNKY